MIESKPYHQYGLRSIMATYWWLVWKAFLAYRQRKEEFIGKGITSAMIYGHTGR
jgi:hypothetical protein